MSVSNKIKSLMSIKEIRSIELAGFLGMSPQSLRNKFNRGSFSAEDLMKSLIPQLCWGEWNKWRR